MSEQTGPIVLQEAYSLIGRFTRGEIQAGKAITPHEKEQLLVLAADLGCPIERPLDQLILQCAAIDTDWNKRAQATIAQFYEKREAGHLPDAEKIRAGFLNSCPSAWYRGIIADL